MHTFFEGIGLVIFGVVGGVILAIFVWVFVPYFLWWLDDPASIRIFDWWFENIRFFIIAGAIVGLVSGIGMVRENRKDILNP